MLLLLLAFQHHLEAIICVVSMQQGGLVLGYHNLECISCMLWFAATNMISREPQKIQH
jgi:hypothetical protein